MNKQAMMAQYLSHLEDAIVALEPRHAGKLDWYTCKHFWFTNVPVGVAAEKYCASHPVELL